jgi:4-hydroxyphenylpyruvate dioxygenase
LLLQMELFFQRCLCSNEWCVLFRPTIFIEIIQRIGCMEKEETSGVVVQKGGCGGFGKGNFSELFKSIEEYEKTLDGSLKA